VVYVAGAGAVAAMSDKKKLFATHRWCLPFAFDWNVSACERCGMERTFLYWQGCCAIYRYAHGKSAWSGVGPGMCNLPPEPADE